MRKILENDISTLNLGKGLVTKLKENDINSIYDLCTFSRMELSNIGLENPQITNITVELQLLGIDLKKNHAKRNTSIDSYLK